MTGDYLLTNSPLSFYKNESTNFSVEEQAVFGIGENWMCVCLCMYTYVFFQTQEYSLCE